MLLADRLEARDCRDHERSQDPSCRSSCLQIHLHPGGCELDSGAGWCRLKERLWGPYFLCCRFDYSVIPVVPSLAGLAARHQQIDPKQTAEHRMKKSNPKKDLAT